MRYSPVRGDARRAEGLRHPQDGWLFAKQKDGGREKVKLPRSRLPPTVALYGGIKKQTNRGTVFFSWVDFVKLHKNA